MRLPWSSNSSNNSDLVVEASIKTTQYFLFFLAKKFKFNKKKGKDISYNRIEFSLTSLS